MTWTYLLDRRDFLQHQLFVASKSERIKRQRRKSWIIVSGCMVLLAVLFYERYPLFSYCFAVVGVVTVLFYPIFQRNQYRKHYEKYIAETYQNRFGQTAEIRFTEYAIETTDTSGESRINLSELQCVTETDEYFYLGVKSGGNLIVPKLKINDLEQLRRELKRLCERLHVSFIEDLNWRWK